MTFPAARHRQHPGRAPLPRAHSLVCCALLLSLLSACKIVIETSAGGSVLSRTGERNCLERLTCQVDVVQGDHFSESFSAMPEPGYRFQGWVEGEGHLCGGTREICRLEGIPANATRNDLEFRLVASFVPDTSFRVIPKNSFFDGPARRALNIPFQVHGDGGDTYQVGLQGDDPALYEWDVEGQKIVVTPADVEEVTVLELVVTGESASGVSSEPVQVTVYPRSNSGRIVTLLGSPGLPGIHLVVVGEGYTREELGKLRSDAFDVYEVLIDDESISRYMGPWHLHILVAPSEESGADAIFGQDTRNTTFDAGYSCSGISRLICVNKPLVRETLASEFPEYDQAVVLVNSTRPGGAGGEFAIASTHDPTFLAHELGHSFADLADEYVDLSSAGVFGPFYTEGAYANVSTSEDPYLVPWSHWIEDKGDYPRVPGRGGVGIFEGAYYHASGYYRPTDNSRMRATDVDFGPVNAEQWILTTYRELSPVLGVIPDPASGVRLRPGQQMTFSVNLTFGRQAQSVAWFVDGAPRPGLADRSTIRWGSDKPGSYRLSAKIVDSSGQVRDDPLGDTAGEVSWSVEVR